MFSILGNEVEKDLKEDEEEVSRPWSTGKVMWRNCYVPWHELNRVVSILCADEIPIVSIRCNFTHLSVKECRLLADGLKMNSSVTELDVSNNEVQDEGAVHLGGTLRCNSKLVSLKMAKNEITDEGIAGFCEGLKFNSSLTELAVGDSRIADRGCIAISSILKSPICQLTSLSLWGAIGDHGAQHLAKAIHVNTTLQKLDFGASRAGQAGQDAMAEAIKASAESCKT